MGGGTSRLCHTTSGLGNVGGLMTVQIHFTCSLCSPYFDHLSSPLQFFVGSNNELPLFRQINKK